MVSVINPSFVFDGLGFILGLPYFYLTFYFENTVVFHVFTSLLYCIFSHLVSV